MPLTAHLEGHGTLDATLTSPDASMRWENVYRTRPRRALTCVQCGVPMHAKVSGRGGRFFAHDRRTSSCAASGETHEHRSLKRALAAAAREAGHRAELEVTAAHSGWRADVLVTAPGRRPIAFEAQVSSASVDDVVARTLRYHDDGVAAVWFTHRATRWLRHVPAARLYRPALPVGHWSRMHPHASTFSVVDCEEICNPRPFWHSRVHASWSDDGEERPLARFVADVLHRRLVPRTTTTALGTRYDGWASPDDIQAAADHGM
ncbi:competence protein CoiA family protein [Streptomyces niveus]|uniref:competence protein CoiA family protein n=1 Tax=Streptomyces niveus TaxID=193462 RepID=UPI003443D104